MMEENSPRAALERAREALETAEEAVVVLNERRHNGLANWRWTGITTVNSQGDCLSAFEAIAVARALLGTAGETGRTAALEVALGRLLLDCSGCGGTGLYELNGQQLSNTPCPRCAPARALLAEENK